MNMEHSSGTPTNQERIKAHRGAMRVISELAATEPQVPIRYPERSRALYGLPPNPAFTAAGVELSTEEARAKALEAFEHSDRLDGETHLIVTGEREGEPVTLILRRALFREGPSSTSVGESLDERADMFRASKVRLGDDGQTMAFDHHGWESPRYAGFNEMQVNGMYLVPEVKMDSHTNYDQMRRGRLSRALGRLSLPRRPRSKEEITLS